MDIASIFLWILGALAIAYQLFVSVLVLRSTFSSKGQKVAQILLIWIVPLLGAFIAHWVVHSTEEKALAIDRNFIREEHTHW